MEIATLILGIFTAIATTAIAVVVYFASARSYAAQARASLLAAINDFNALALTNDACLRAATSVLTGAEPQNLDEARKIWAIYSLLNNRQVHYFTAMTQHTSKEYLKSDARIIASILGSPGARDLLISGGYDPGFVKHCLAAVGDDETTTSN